MHYAGVDCLEGSLTVDGFEKHMAVNHLGHFLLMHLLLDRLKEAPSARIVNVSSAAYKFYDSFNFANMNSIDPTRYSANITKNAGYGQSKIAQILFTRALSWHEFTKVFYYFVANIALFNINCHAYITNH